MGRASRAGRLTRRIDRRRVATFLAVLALLIQQGLIPVLHYALGGASELRAQIASTGEHLHHGASGEGSDPGDTSHGPCHFCRVLGAVLPPPPIAELSRLEPGRVVFSPPVAKTRPAAWSSRAHPARAPPSPPILV